MVHAVSKIVCVVLTASMCWPAENQAQISIVLTYGIQNQALISAQIVRSGMAACGLT